MRKYFTIIGLILILIAEIIGFSYLLIHVVFRSVKENEEPIYSVIKMVSLSVIGAFVIPAVLISQIERQGSKLQFE